MWSEPGYSIAYALGDHIAQNYSNITVAPDPLDIQPQIIIPPDQDDDGILWDNTDNKPDTNTNDHTTDTMLVPWLSQGGTTQNDAIGDTDNKFTIASQIQREIQREHSHPKNNILTTEANNQLELMVWHERLGHLQMSKIQRMAEAGLLPKNIAKCRQPLCQSCMYGMMVKRSWRTKQTPTHIAPNAMRPGEHVSVDQMESPVPGLIGQLKGTPTLARYKFATIFVDTYSRSSYAHLQQTSNADETLQAKKSYEAFAKTHGVHIQHYHADNGRFIETAWQQHANLMGQTLSYAGVGAHHQNGIVEKRIRDIQDLARASLIHAIRRWPDAITTHLWPYALRKANASINQSLPPKAISTPINCFSNQKQLVDLKHEHPFGCPAYVLDRKMQSGLKGPKWESRSRVGIYLGNSEFYADTISLILSLSTGLVSPQYHVKHDDTFITLAHHMGNVIPNSQWQLKCGFLEKPRGKYKFIGLQDVSLTETQVPGTRQHIEEEAFHDPTEIEEAIQAPNEPVAPNEPIPEVIIDTPVTTRSGRLTGPPSHLQNYVVYETISQIATIVPDIDCMSPLAFGATSDPDVLYYHEAMAAHDSHQFRVAMDDEINNQTKNGNWTIVHRSDLTPDTRVLPSVWAMRRKRKVLDGTIYKWKARLNIDGGKQVHGLDYWETYAPVTSWSTIRMILTLAVVNQWVVKQLDFVQAYPQAPIQTPLYMEIPKGFEINGSSKNHVLKLLRNIYGQKQAGRVWNEFLTQGLLKIGFVQSQYDMCLLWRKSCTLVIYTDDTIVTGPDALEVAEAINDIGTVFDITINQELVDFLGVNINMSTDGSITFSQPNLINSIIKDLGLDENSTSRRTPTVSNVVLHAHSESTPHVESWHYRAIIGKLNYLEKSSRPDISYAVHQCARFCENPKMEHSAAVKRIGRYLLGNRTQGVTFRADSSSLVCYTDASFLGEWLKETAEHDPITARSRTGYLITYANCPLIWSSKLQTEITHSATEAEYVALSQSLKEVTALMLLMEELKKCQHKIKPGNTHCPLHGI
jgi:hypothetical protein